MNSSALDAVKEGSKALGKLEDLALKFAGPSLTKKQADADAYADAKRLETIRNNPDMEIVYVNGEMNARERTPEELLRRAQTRQLIEAARQQKNIETVLDFAALEVAHQFDDDVSDEAVDDDWVTRFFDIVKDVSAEELQFVWGKILAGEIKKPGSFSFRTLDVIRNISRTEAEIFQKVIPFALMSGESLMIPQSEEILSKYGIEYKMLMQLDESGLLNVSGTIGLSGNVNEKLSVIAHIGPYYFFANAKPSTVEKYHFGIYPFTKAGSELYSILDHEANENYLIEVAHNMQKENEKIIITMYKRGEKDENGHAPVSAVDIS